MGGPRTSPIPYTAAAWSDPRTDLRRLADDHTRLVDVYEREHALDAKSVWADPRAHRV